MKNTTQKIIAIVLMISLCVPTSVVAQAIKQVPFGGFDFEDYTPSRNGLDVKVEDEVKKILNGNKGVNPYTTPYALVGHSQGGLRALAAATELKRTAAETAYSNLKAVITVSGANKGIQALRGGLPAVRSRLFSDVNTVMRGVKSTYSIARDLLKFIFGLGYLLPPGQLLPNDYEFITTLIVSLIPGVNDYIKLALLPVATPFLAEINDMVPGNSFIEENVSDTKEHTYRVRSGTRYAWEWRSRKRGWFRYYYLTRASYPVYSTYKSYEDTPKFDKNLPVGYIVGMDSDTLGMAGDSMKSTVLDTARALQITFGTAEGLHIVKCIGFWGLFTGSVRFAQDARAAKNWMGNIEGEIDDHIGSSRSDGLIAVESQFYSSTFRDPNTGQVRETHNNISGTSGTSYIAVNYNHDNINPFVNKEGGPHVRSLIAGLLNRVPR